MGVRPRIGHDIWPELQARQRRRQAPESLLASFVGAGLAAGFVYVMGFFVLLVGV